MRALTPEEQAAIEGLRKLAETWPESLSLLVTSLPGRVYVVDTPREDEEDLRLRPSFAKISIPIDSCA